jgi:hypothetical protein
MKPNKNICPVCAYPTLNEPARSKSGGGSYEICPSCGFQFGVDDDDKGITFDQARAKWLAGGAKWSSKGVAKPKGWDGAKQVASIPKSVIRKAARKRPAK